MPEHSKAVQVENNRVIYFLFIFIQSVVISHGCHQNERNALLSFKSLFQDPSSRMSSWQIGSNQNCCEWRGIQCSTNSFHVVSIDIRNTDFDTYLEDKVNQFIPIDDILAFRHRTSLSGTISPSLLELTNLEYLDLSLNRFSFPEEISYNFSFLKRLMHLDLSYSGFDGSITTQFANLSSLQYLDISSALEISEVGDGSIRIYSSYIQGFTVQTKSSSTNWVRGLVKLKVLRLNDVKLDEAGENWAEPISFLGDLTELHLSGCFIDSPFPTNEILNLSRLSYLKMDHNHFNCPFPTNLSNISSLSVLDLGGCGLQGSVPYFPQLKYLRVSANYRLQINLTLMFALQKPTIIKTKNNGSTPSSISAVLPMVSLLASGCSIQGPLPATISNLRLLHSLDLSENNITGAVPESLCDNLSLRMINLARNSITGSFPSCITKLQNLSRLDISYNYMEGIVSLNRLINELNLTRLNFNSNKLHVEFGRNPLRSTEFPLKMLELRSCNLQGSILAFFCNFSNLDKLDLSGNNLTGAIPACLFDGPNNLTYINLSWNNLSGPLPLPPQNIIVFDLSQNKLTGEISTEVGKRLINAYSIYLSGNELSGLIPCSMCIEEEKRLFSTVESLDLSNNLLSGSIPSCLASCTDLVSLNLGMNRFTGNFPNTYVHSNLEVLELNDNSLTGTFPILFESLDRLEVLNLANNDFEGAIPTSIGLLPDLRILSLRSNKFNGSIPKEIMELQKLQILDLSINNLSGRIPGNMSNLDMLIRRPNNTFLLASPLILYGLSELELEMVLKGIVINFKYVYNYHSGIDLSCNSFEGNIPEEIVVLKGLSMLNLSHNRLSGNIPGSVGDMMGLQSLDLSFNKLSGPVPQSLASIDSLGYLNLSYNNLSGRIPRGHHFETLSLDGSAFFGNDLLCGVPTNKSCEGDTTSTDIKDDEEHPRERLLYYGVVAVGFVVGFWGLFFVLLIKKEKWWFGYWRVVDTIAVRITGCMLRN